MNVVHTSSSIVRAHLWSRYCYNHENLRNIKITHKIGWNYLISVPCQFYFFDLIQPPMNYSITKLIFAHLFMSQLWAHQVLKTPKGCKVYTPSLSPWSRMCCPWNLQHTDLRSVGHNEINIPLTVYKLMKPTKIISKEQKAE